MICQICDQHAYERPHFFSAVGAGCGAGEELVVGPGVGARGAPEAEAGAGVELTPVAGEGGGAEEVAEGTGLGRERISESSVVWLLIPSL